MPEIQSDLLAEVLTANTEHVLHIPAGTRRIQFKTRSAFPVRVSLVQGDVLNNRGFLLIGEADTKQLGGFPGPIYYASTQPHALLDVTCWVFTSPRRQSLGGAFNSAFSLAFDGGIAGQPTGTLLTNRFGGQLYSNIGKRLITNVDG